MRKTIDKWFLGITLVLVFAGIFIFVSASFGVLARESGLFMSVLFNQFMSLALGLGALYIASRIHYRFWRQYSFYIFLLSIILTAAVFIPGAGFEHGGATRWISLWSFSFQPSELLKIGFIFYFAAWLQGFRERTGTFLYGFLPLATMVGIVGFLLLKQPDTGTFLVFFGIALAMFVASGASWKHSIGLLGVVGIGIGALMYVRPYVKERFLTFINPALDPQGAGYQIQQALIAIGSGGIWGRGFGQSVQKFGFLPEPIGDSIFAVFAEEFGFVGSMTLLALFLVFAIRGLKIARRAPDHYARLVALGIVILILGQAFLNIGSMIGVFPLTGLPLPFVSHGGTSLIITLFGVGVILNISRYCKT